MRQVRRRRRRRSVAESLWWFILPAALVYVAVVILPNVQGVILSFTDWTGSPRPPEFNGLENYVDVFRDDAGEAFVRTVFVALVVVVVQNALGLGLALLLNGRIAGRNVLRTIIFAPLVVSPLVVGYLFKYLFGPPGIGGINTVVGSLGLDEADFLGNPSTALWIVIVAVVWQFTGSSMVIFLAGLQGVPAELQEAAALDGAGYWRRFWSITWPLLWPATTVNLMLGLIGGLKLFDAVFAITGGGPGGQTETVSTLIYQLFAQSGQFGQAAALAAVLAVAVGILSFVQFSVLRRQEQKQ